VRVAIIGTGFIGTTLGTSLVAAGHEVILGSRDPDRRPHDALSGRFASISEALRDADVVILAIPGPAVLGFAEEFATELHGQLIVDATNQMGASVANARSALPTDVRYARAFNTLGGENLANPTFSDGRADLFYSSPPEDRSTLEELIDAVGLRPINVGEDQEELIDALFRLWIALALEQGRGRRLALRLMED